MNRTLFDIDAERRRFEQKRNALRRLMERLAAAATDTWLSNMRQLLRDCDTRIETLTEEMKSKRTLSTD
ncbi:hypothetical protein [Rikenella microfusus]|uniref:Uncharacterized protein n=1 Tax=Rikenella microfusus TaxID=28139 RepID=A0A379MQ95_9BACT|nr:hypothetical protein [Rikenella microfusus]SUE33646.1 Uncharacterised protein [Rikenella microfusus]